MRYLYLFIALALAGLIAAIALARVTHHRFVMVLGILGTIAAAVLFYHNKSDSVADTYIEYVADAVPPLVSASFVIGWWIGYAILSGWQRWRARA